MKLSHKKTFRFLNIILVFGIIRAHKALPQSSDLGIRRSLNCEMGSLNNKALNQYDSIFNTAYWKGFGEDLNRIVRAPAAWDCSEWITVASLSSIAFGLYLSDNEIQEVFQKNRSQKTNEISKISVNFGEPSVALSTISLFYLHGKLNDNSRARKTSLLSLESFLMANLFNQSLKYAGRRHRANSGDSSTTWDGPGFHSSPVGGDPDGLSFPSGHAASTFAIASVIASEYEDHRIMPVLAYSASIICALSRINDNEHWPSDVFCGALIGYFTGKTIVRLHRKTGQQKSTIVIPVAGNSRVGLVISCRI